MILSILSQLDENAHDQSETSFFDWWWSLPANNDVLNNKQYSIVSRVYR